MFLQKIVVKKVQKIIKDSFFVQSLFPKMVQDFVCASFGFYVQYVRNESGFEYVKIRYSLGLGLELPVFEFVYAFLLGVGNFFYIKNNELIWFYFRIFYIIFVK